MSGISALPLSPATPTESSATRQPSPHVQPAALLQPLARSTRLLPERFSERSRVLTALRRIESVALHDVVTKRDGHRVFRIDVYFKLAHHRIPKPGSQAAALLLATSRASAASTTRVYTCAPDVQLEKGFADFAKLRDDMYARAHAAHDIMLCAFCADVAKGVVLGEHQPRASLRMFGSDDHVRAVLARFVNDALATALRVRAFGGSASCSGQEAIPALVQQFLLPEDRAPDDATAAASASARTC